MVIGQNVAAMAHSQCNFRWDMANFSKSFAPISGQFHRWSQPIKTPLLLQPPGKSGQFPVDPRLNNFPFSALISAVLPKFNQIHCYFSFFLFFFIPAATAAAAAAAAAASKPGPLETKRNASNKFDIRWASHVDGRCTQQIVNAGFCSRGARAIWSIISEQHTRHFVVPLQEKQTTRRWWRRGRRRRSGRIGNMN